MLSVTVDVSSEEFVMLIVMSERQLDTSLPDVEAVALIIGELPITIIIMDIMRIELNIVCRNCFLVAFLMDFFSF